MNQLLAGIESSSVDSGKAASTEAMIHPTSVQLLSVWGLWLCRDTIYGGLSELVSVSSSSTGVVRSLATSSAGSPGSMSLGDLEADTGRPELTKQRSQRVELQQKSQQFFERR